MDEPVTVYSFNGIQHRIKKEYTSHRCDKLNEYQKLLWRANEDNNNKVHIIYYLYEAVEEAKIIYNDGNKIISCLTEERGYVHEVICYSAKPILIHAFYLFVFYCK